MSEKKILIVDDNLNMASLLSDVLEVFSCQTIQASNGEEALRFLKEEKFDLVITDLRMPKMNGIDLLQATKESYPNLPVVVITGYKLEAPQEAIVYQAADGFLAKPFKVQDVEQMLKRLLNFSSEEF